MNAILLAALLYKATLIAPPKVQLRDVYAYAGFTESQCHVTDWTWWDNLPLEAECNGPKGSWAHFELDPEDLQ